MKTTKRTNYQIGGSARNQDRQNRDPKPKCAGCKEPIKHDDEPVFVHKWKENENDEYYKVDQWCGKVDCMRHLEGDHKSKFRRKNFSECHAQVQKELVQIWNRESIDRNQN